MEVRSEIGALLRRLSLADFPSRSRLGDLPFLHNNSGLLSPTGASSALAVCVRSSQILAVWNSLMLGVEWSLFPIEEICYMYAAGASVSK